MNRPVACLLFVLGISCASTLEDEDRPFVVRAVPGPDAMQTFYQFDRGALSILATCKKLDDQPSFDLTFTNHGGGRIQISPAGLRLIYDGRATQQAGVQMFDSKGKRLLQLVLLANDSQMVSLRPVGIDIRPKKLVVLEVRGIRDDRGDGGFDFDLYATREAAPGVETQGTTVPKREEKPTNLFGETIRR